MDNLIVLLLCLLGGFLLKKTAKMPLEAHIPINFFVIYISLPAVALLYIPQIQLSSDIFIPLSVGIVVFTGAFLFFFCLYQLKIISRSYFACLLVVCGLGNTSFIGFPLTSLYYGEAGLQVAVIADQGTFVTLATLGVASAMFFSEGTFQVKIILQRIITFPPFIAFVLALLLPKYLLQELVVVKTLEKLSATLVPLALFSVGLQLQFKLNRDSFKYLSIGLFYKLLLAPFIIWLLFYSFTKNEIVLQASVLEAAMPPMVTAAILASQYKLKADFAQLLVGVGVIVALASTFCWYLFLNKI